MNTESVWEKVSVPPTYPVLEGNIMADVLIIGAGITGLTAGLELARAGLKSVIVEARRIGSGTTGYSTGNLYIAVQPYYQNILAKFGQETVSAVARSRKEALDYIELTVKNHDIDCHFSRRPGYMFVGEKRKNFLEKEIETLKTAGIEAEYEKNLPFPSDGSFAAHFPNQARFNPKSYINGLAKIFTDLGGQLFENSAVIMAEEKSGPCFVRTTHGSVTASKMIMATHTPKGIHTMQALAAPYRSYVVAAALKGNQYPNGHFWNADPHGYISSTHAVLGSELDMLMVAGGHHKTGQAGYADAEHYYKNIENYIRNNFEIESVLHRWSAQHYQTADDLPYIGLAHRRSKDFYIAGGYFADGLTYGVVAGRILADLVQGKDNPWAKTYDSLRCTPRASARKAIRENVNVLCEYMKDFPGADIVLLSDIKPGEGRIVEIGGEKCAVYRDENHGAHAVSAVCTHMKCIVQFNNAEKTWDCPCHGSRFALDGSVLEGPAWQPLAPRSTGARSAGT